MAAFLGWLNSQSLIGILIWVGIIFISVLIHEYGHALTATAFRQRAQIQLIVFGGLTTYAGPRLSFWKQFLIVLNGPLAGIGLFILASFLLFFPLQGEFLRWVKLFQFVNLFWSVVNLLPVLPLDGGQLLRIALEGFFGIKGFKISLLIGTTIAILVSFYFFLIQAFLAGAFFFLFAFQSFDTWRRSRFAISADREEEMKNLLIQGEERLQKGDKEGAAQLFEQVREKARGGILASAASQYLAFFYLEQGKKEEAYELLAPLKKDLSDEARCLLHQLADLEGNSQLVAELSADCYQILPNQEVALRNAKAFALLNEPQKAGGWLQTAWQYGPFNLNELLQQPEFKQVRGHPAFQAFVEPLQ